MEHYKFKGISTDNLIMFILCMRNTLLTSLTLLESIVICCPPTYIVSSCQFPSVSSQHSTLRSTTPMIPVSSLKQGKFLFLFLNVQLIFLYLFVSYNKSSCYSNLLPKATLIFFSTSFFVFVPESTISTGRI